MYPQHFAEHFARLRQAYKNYNIRSLEQIVDIDEKGFPLEPRLELDANLFLQQIGEATF